MRPRWRKVLSDLWSNMARSALVVASISIGLFAIGIIISIRVVLQEDLQAGYALVNPANIRITPDRLFDQDLVDHISHITGVSQAEGVFTASLRILTGPDEWKSISLKSLRNFNKMKIDQVHLEQGRWPPGKNEIVIEHNKLADTHAHIGDKITLQLPTGKTHVLTLVGVVHDQTIGAAGIGGGFFLAPIQGYISHDTLAFLNLPDLYNQLYVTVQSRNDDKAYITQVSKRVIQGVENSNRVVQNQILRTSYEHPNGTYVDAISNVLVLLGLFVVFLSAFLVTNTISALLAQQVQQIGVMKTVGARRYQVVQIYMMVLFIYGLLACLVAIPLSYFASNRILEFLASKINFVVLGYRIVPLSVGLQIAIALLVPQIAGFMPILHGSNISVQEALSGYQTASSPLKKTWIDRRLLQIRSVSRPMRISLRNVFRRRGRLALTLITLSLGGAVFIATFNVRASLNEHVAQVSKYFLADVNLTFDRPYRIDRIQRDVSRMPGVQQVEGWGTASAEMVLPDGSVGENVHILAPPTGSGLIEPVLLSGRWLQPGDQNAIVLSELFISRFPEIKIGQPIQLKLDGENTSWVVTGFFQMAGKSGGLLAYADYETLSQRIHQANKAQTFRIVAQGKNLSMDQQKALGRQMEVYLRGLGYQIVDIQAGSSLYTSAAEGLNVLTVFLLIMAILIALVGSIGLSGTMSMNVMERTREIGVMRSIGASDRVLSRLVITEGVIIGLFSWLIGSILTFPMSKIMSDTINMAIFDAPSRFTFTPLGFVIWLAVVIFLSILASVLPARNATRLTIREVLAYE
jgi:putative ABC transport system permease protein